MKFPSIKDVAHEIRVVNVNTESECDVRLQVYEDGTWIIRSGDSSYDQDHTGYWGASCIPGYTKRFNSLWTARDLIEQAKDQYASR